MSNPIIASIVICSAIFLALHLASRLLLLSFRSRAKKLFGSSPWLPIRRGLPCQDAETVEFVTHDQVKLVGSYFRCSENLKNGVVIYCHELNGTRFGVTPYVRKFMQSGFDVFAFDMRNHGESQEISDFIPTPWVTKHDLADLRAAIDYLCRQNDNNSGNNHPDDKSINIGVFGVSKGATIAACMAGLDSRIAALVLDSPAPEGRLFERDCWTTLTRGKRRWATIFSRRYTILFCMAVVFSLACPFVMIVKAWWRLILGYWYGCRFISTRPLVCCARQPIFIIHGNQDHFCRVDQIHAFCHRMPHRPSVWIVLDSSHGETAERAGDEYTEKIVDFFKKSFSRQNLSLRVDSAVKEKVPFFLREFVQSPNSLASH